MPWKNGGSDFVAGNGTAGNLSDAHVVGVVFSAAGTK